MKDKIFEICESLTNQGIKPTLENVRKQLGGGSFSTINPILKQWKEQSQVVKTDLEIPSAAIAAVEQAVRVIWRIATDHQAEAINAIRVESSRIEQIALAERDDAFREIEQLEQKIKDLELKNAEYQQTVDSLIQENKAKDSQIVKFQIELEKQHLSVQNCVKSLEKAESNAKLLQEQREAQNGVINELRASLSNSELSVKHLGQNFEKITAEHEKLKAKLDSVTESKNSLDKQVTKLQTSLDSKISELEKITVQRDGALASEKIAIEKSGALSGQLEILIKENKALKKGAGEALKLNTN